MKVAIIGSRSLNVDSIGSYIPNTVTCIVSGGAIGIDTIAKDFALSNNIPIIEYLPEYNIYGRSAPSKETC